MKRDNIDLLIHQLNQIHNLLSQVQVKVDRLAAEQELKEKYGDKEKG